MINKQSRSDKKLRIFFSLMLFVIWILAGFVSSIDNHSDEIVYGDLDFDFQSLIVSMTHVASLKFIDYTPSHFMEIDVISVYDLTSPLIENMRQEFRFKQRNGVFSHHVHVFQIQT